MAAPLHALQTWQDTFFFNALFYKLATHPFTNLSRPAPPTHSPVSPQVVDLGSGYRPRYVRGGDAKTICLAMSHSRAISVIAGEGKKGHDNNDKTHCTHSSKPLCEHLSACFLYIPQISLESDSALYYPFCCPYSAHQSPPNTQANTHALFLHTRFPTYLLTDSWGPPTWDCIITSREARPARPHSRKALRNHRLKHLSRPAAAYWWRRWPIQCPAEQLHRHYHAHSSTILHIYVYTHSDSWH